MKKLFFILTISALANLSMTEHNTSISYTIKIDDPHTHYADVDITIDGIHEKYVDFKMPVWTPGSYLVREFAKSVENVKSNAGEVTQINKNTWRVMTEGKHSVTLSYRLYAYEKSVRTTFIDADHAFLHNTSCFMFIEKFQHVKGTLKINKPSNWKHISTSLEGTDGTYSFVNYDELADTPIEIGNHDLFTFEVNGIPHTVAMVGRSNCDYKQFEKDLKKLCESAMAVFGEHPCKKYLFIIHNVHSGGGGLEHLNSTCVMMNRWDYDNPSRYLSFLGLCAHEYFHLWNVKRLRPIALGPFNYDEENYTHMLWVAEGITNYYDELLPARSGFASQDQFLHTLSGRINSVENRAGNEVQSLASASWNAWIKAYRPNENSMNTTVSYYTKGLVVSAMLDILIVEQTKGEKHLDDLMQSLYKKYYQSLNRGFTDEEFVKEVNSICGSDQASFFDSYVFGTGPIDYNKYFEKVGLRIVNTNKGQKPNIGITLKNNKVTYVETNSSANKGGINVHDELIAIDGIRLSDKNFEDVLKMYVGKKVAFTVSRDNLLRTLDVEVAYDQSFKYKIEPLETAGKEQKTLLNKWLSNVSN